MRAIIFLFLMFLFTSCDVLHVEKTPDAPGKGTLADEVTNKAFAQLKMEKGLYPFGTGARMMDQIKMLALAFHYYKEVDIGEGRELLIFAATVFLNIINSNEQIRPYLQNYPFRPENIQVRIFLKKPDGSECSSEKLCVIKMIDGVLEYEIDHPERHTLQTVYEESYVEAISKLSTVVAFRPDGQE